MHARLRVVVDSSKSDELELPQIVKRPPCTVRVCKYIYGGVFAQILLRSFTISSSLFPIFHELKCTCQHDRNGRIIPSLHRMDQSNRKISARCGQQQTATAVSIARESFRGKPKEAKAAEQAASRDLDDANRTADVRLNLLSIDC